jgi:hypothetical protein
VSSFNYGIKKRRYYNGNVVNRIADTEVPQNNFLKAHKYGLRSVALCGNGEAMGVSNTLPK